MKLLKLLSQSKVIALLVLINIGFLVAIHIVRNSYPILDIKFFYMKSEIQSLFMFLGEEGRATYIKVNFLDFGFILSYTLLFLGVYFAFFKDLAKSLIIVPICLALADLSETSIICYLLNFFPETKERLEYALVLLTPLKWMLALSSLMVVINGYFVNLYIKKSK